MLELSSAVSALLGAAVGAGGSLGVSALTARAQAREAARTRVGQVTDHRRTVASSFLEAVDRYTDDARVLIAALDDRAADDWLAAAEERYAESWRELARRDAPVQIAGPAELGHATRDLRGAAADLGNALDTWFRAGPRSRTVTRETEEVDARLDRVIEAKRRYIALAQRLFDPTAPAGRAGSAG